MTTCFDTLPRNVISSSQPSSTVSLLPGESSSMNGVGDLPPSMSQSMTGEMMSGIPSPTNTNDAPANNVMSQSMMVPSSSLMTSSTSSLNMKTGKKYIPSRSKFPEYLQLNHKLKVQKKYFSIPGSFISWILSKPSQTAGLTHSGRTVVLGTSAILTKKTLGGDGSTPQKDQVIADNQWDFHDNLVFHWFHDMMLSYSNLGPWLGTFQFNNSGLFVF